MNGDAATKANTDDEPIDGGEIGELKDIPFEDKKHRAETARSLALWLVWILAGSVALHYLLTLILLIWAKEEAVKGLNSIFNAWLPAISSLVSAAATYYFTREK
ncbi:hypothetical protein VT84_07445 [Gemmata sp. SH-PL17]|uniref:hypothetical protein n=1 Tax=Gemmata sp. SH-PL17 TaxID=1630693 RepID=UPI00078E9D0B|nr:hypothetical protein [Gemmata sp. SH-PL17]AMV24215.1 hypothetical protein VT84_07445 [Gemmata sp. SH-PL17]